MNISGQAQTTLHSVNIKNSMLRASPPMHLREPVEAPAGEHEDPAAARRGGDRGLKGEAREAGLADPGPH